MAAAAHRAPLPDTTGTQPATAVCGAAVVSGAHGGGPRQSAGRGRGGGRGSQRNRAPLPVTHAAMALRL